MTLILQITLIKKIRVNPFVGNKCKKTDEQTDTVVLN